MGRLCISKGIQLREGVTAEIPPAFCLPVHVLQGRTAPPRQATDFSFSQRQDANQQQPRGAAILFLKAGSLYHGVFKGTEDAIKNTHPYSCVPETVTWGESILLHEMLMIKHRQGEGASQLTLTFNSD